ncbi:hypothetical protein SD71_07940 [Cohnella kolymensis]|uniref:precorrin-2 dehydrogenase n=2 Tax=Cohnella kolymensis TaxID=1590652 RepID=A0ABR5A5W2_9BACL|nr:hypothetical protein SD71_07940 [Cohnella kolymensis]
MLNLEGRRCVVIGGGSVAERKISGLLEAGAAVSVFSLGLTEHLRELVHAGKIEWAKRPMQDEDLDGAALVFAATDRQDINAQAAQAARARGIHANVADDGAGGDFIVPAVLRRGDLIVTASTSGAAPALAARVVNEMAVRYGPEYAEYVKVLETVRSIVKSEVEDSSERRKLLNAAVTEDALEEWRSASWLQDKGKLVERLRQRANYTRG